MKVTKKSTPEMNLFVSACKSGTSNRLKKIGPETLKNEYRSTSDCKSTNAQHNF